MSRGRQHFRRNIAPVLGALLLMGIGIGAWVLLGMRATREATGILHDRFAVGADVTAVRLPEDGYAVLVFRQGEHTCATFSVQPEAATLIDAQAVPRTVARAEAADLLARAAPGIARCDGVDVRVFANRIPWHGRFEARYSGTTVTAVEAPRFGE